MRNSDIGSLIWLENTRLANDSRRSIFRCSSFPCSALLVLTHVSADRRYLNVSPIEEVS